ncbi:hypothetical protein BOTBODRAFT_162335 [Botryobasidium botryosum FD-172 SS1]|uniref:Serine/threonine-protein kinase Tel1 n=1 Tax=Botryobasidium botryosum (strain FD-172 SS1) TaxID=930990 RepID=A0A067MJ57_BOTB1|nr:hypothetical protein BOTBODRAFT_162335 [Botryobasidium botryosum FD-172 SS1]
MPGKFLDQLNSSKVLERQRGLDALREDLGRRDAMESVDERGDGGAWLEIFQAVFAVVVAEQRSYVQKGAQNATAAATRRLGNAASTLRWLTERSMLFLNRKVVTALNKHIIEMIVYKNKLLAPVATDYSSTLHAVLSYPPHLDNVDSDVWIEMVSLSFGVILDENLDSDLATDGESNDEDDNTPEDDDYQRKSGTAKRIISYSSRSIRSPAPSTSRHTTVSNEQIRFSSILLLLLRSARAPYLSAQHPELPKKILDKLYRFFVVFPSETSAHLDAVQSINAVLSHLELNAKVAVTSFGIKMWQPLVELLGTKNKVVKEGVVLALRTLFPFVTHKDAEEDVLDQLVGLGKRIEEDSERKILGALDLDCLRLEVRNPWDKRRPFETDIIRSGERFDSIHALRWATLELHADAIAKASQLWQSTLERRGASRTFSHSKTADPILALLSDMDKPALRAPAYRRQVLFFLVDRHWKSLPLAHRVEILDRLLNFLAKDADPTLQSWTFLSYSSIFFADRSSTADWTFLWNHAIHQTHFPGVSRVACHTAYILLGSKSLPPQMVLPDIESLTNKLVVQGPPVLHDAVCAFLSQCLRVVSQDVRLFKMQLEEKVLAWLFQTWLLDPGAVKGSHTPRVLPKDVLLLLESICGLSQHFDMVHGNLLPDCATTQRLLEEQETSVIRDYLLHTRIPPFRETTSPTPNPPPPAQFTASPEELSAPSAREQRASAFLGEFLGVLLAEWTPDKRDFSNHENVRRLLDVAVLALSFEAALVLNGIRSNRTVISDACRLLIMLAESFVSEGRNAQERAFIILGLEPLVNCGDPALDHQTGWEAVEGPGDRTGVPRQILLSLTAPKSRTPDGLIRSRQEAHKVIWESSEMQDAFDAISKALKLILQNFFGDGQGSGRANGWLSSEPGLENMQLPSAQSGTDLIALHATQLPSTTACISVIVSFLTVAPMLQSNSSEPTRDTNLYELFLSPDDNVIFFLLGAELSKGVRNGKLFLSNTDFERILLRFGGLLTTHTFSRNPALHLLLIHFLEHTIAIWSADSVSNGNIGDNIYDLFGWLSKSFASAKQPHWQVRDRYLLLMDRYLLLYPNQHFFEGRGVEATLPTSVMPHALRDDDIRVRFRGAVVCARLFKRDTPELELYTILKNMMPEDLQSYEHMVTRILSMGNIMVISSAIRRGPYWHILELCFQPHSPNYAAHIECVLTAVAERIGLPALSCLVEAYASMVAYSICNMFRANTTGSLGEPDICRLPLKVLGYSTRAEFAKANLMAMGPVLLASAFANDPTQVGACLFKKLCRESNRPVAEAKADCSAQLLALKLLLRLDDSDVPDLDPQSYVEFIRPIVESHAAECDPDAMDPINHLHKHLDRVVSTVMGSLIDEDISENSELMGALQKRSGGARSARGFRALISFRQESTDFKLHRPKLPAYPARTISLTLTALDAIDPNVHHPHTIYHVLHQLFAEAEQTPLLNERLRMINAICLWVAMNLSEFRPGTLLRTLMLGCTTLLSQPDLAHAAQSILDWAFARHKGSGISEPDLPNILNRINRIASDFANDAENAATQNLGRELTVWIEQRVRELAEVDEIRPQISGILSLWPNSSQPTEKLGYETLSELLRNTDLASNKFSLVRPLYNSSTSSWSPAMKEQFSNSDIWHLKSCIPPDHLIRDDDIEAFVSLLYANAGQVGAVSESKGSLRALPLHVEDALSVQVTLVIPKKTIIFLLSQLLSNESASKVYTAYSCLRQISLDPTSGDWAHFKTWLPANILKELDFLRAFPPSKSHRPARSISDLAPFGQPIGFGEWIRGISLLLSDILSRQDDFFVALAPMFQSDVNFAEQALPSLVHSLLLWETNGSPQTIGARQALSSSFSAILEHPDTPVAIIHSIVKVVLHLRNYIFRESDPLSYNYWLDVDYLLLSRGAVSCGAYTTALLFLELSAELKPERNVTLNMTHTEADVMYDIYSHIEEPDGFYGIRSDDIHQFLIRRFHHEKQWERAFQFHGANYESTRIDNSTNHGVVNSLHSLGFDMMAMTFLQMSGAHGSQPGDTLESGYDLGWRTESWDLPVPDLAENPGATMYVALRAIHRDRDPQVMEATVRAALRKEMNRLRSLGNENMTDIKGIIVKLICLGEISKWAVDSRTQHSTDSICRNFQNISSEFEFQDLTTILTTRISLLHSTKHRYEAIQHGDYSPFAEVEKRCLVRISEAARSSNRLQIALNSITRAHQIVKEIALGSFDVSREYALVLWSQDRKVAISSLEAMVQGNREASENGLQRAMLLAQLGEWLSEARLKNAMDIRQRYFAPAIEILFKLKGDLGAPIFHQYAIFAKQQYHAISQSPEITRLEIYIKRKRAEVEDCEKALHTERDPERRSRLTRQKHTAKLQLAQDEARYAAQISSRDKFLGESITSFTRCLRISDDYDGDAVIQICSLWFGNFNDEKLNKDIRRSLEGIPSRKFAFLSHQLSARLSKAGSAGQTNLQGIMKKLTREHPFHSLYQVYALLSSSTTKQTRGHTRTGDESQASRSSAAKSLFDALKSESALQGRVVELENLCRAYLEWATYRIKDKPALSRGGKIPAGLRIHKIVDLRIPVSTIHLAIDPNCRYDNVVFISSYLKEFGTAGGINLPKISICNGTDGRKYKQLFKGEGNDDLRQDAVMEQVFDLVNFVLKRDRETKRRALSIRDYKVIPLAAQAGMMEFVQNTTPLGGWLQAAHLKYRPKDWTSRKCAEELIKARSAANPPEALLKAFNTIRMNFKPVMRHFFTEKHKLPMAWFDMRLRYARSVATSSIVGHIIGLGDRHVSNILLDQETGEVVHIDLGIAFDQGTLLKIPELVPFRLTADMVDGLGLTGTEGVFRRCAEETLRVLRDGSDIIKTVLDVFKYDPLHAWTANPIKINNAQVNESDLSSDVDVDENVPNTDSDTVGGDADRALSSVAQKLDKSMSVEYTVNELIAAATEPRNLSQIYQGWSPHL